MKTKSLYGFSSEFAPFVGKTPAEQVALLKAWGNTVVFGGYQDPAFVDAAHAAGLPVYAEFGCFVGQAWWEELPTSQPLMADGRLLPPEEWYYGVNPAIPQVRRRQLEALETLFATYDLDGVWLDFVRWPCHWEVPHPRLPRTSFDPRTLRQFCIDTGLQVPVDDAKRAAQVLSEHYPIEWREWRCVQITSWVAQARDVVRRVRPNALLGLFGVPWRLADYQGAILDIVGQDYRALGQFVDVFSPMVYHAMCGFSVEWIGQVMEEVKRLSGKPVWPIIQSVDEPQPLLPAEYEAALEVALCHPASDGALVFTLKGALDEAKLAMTRKWFGAE